MTAMITGVEVTYPADPITVRDARQFTAARLADHPALDDVLLLVSELAGNAVRHGGGGTYTITIAAEETGVRVAVTNLTAGGVPRQRAADETGGRGLPLVDALASSWGYSAADGRTTVWFTR